MKCLPCVTYLFAWGQRGNYEIQIFVQLLIAAADRESYAKNLMKDTFVVEKVPLPPSIDMVLTNYAILINIM